MFDLDGVNVGILNQQIEKIPASLAQTGVALGEAEREHKRQELALDIWKADRLMAIGAGSKMTETAKKDTMKSEYSAALIKEEDKVIEAAYLVRLLRSYREGLQAKLQLAQTLSANIRAEGEAFRSGAN